VADVGWRISILALLTSLACASDEPARAALPAALTATWSVPADDRGALCADLTDTRVCWSASEGANDGCANGTCVAARTVPNVAPGSALGWRCVGQGPARKCAPRQRGVGPFVCKGERCVQRHPRFPDDGEWTCDDVGGAAVCTGGDRPAGVPETIADNAWICGGRRRGGRLDDKDDRICVDFAPDFPDGVARGWRCRYAMEAGLSRICERDANAHAMGDRCDTKNPCLDGLHCIANRCLPERPSPSCAFDRDCEEGACRFGTCRKESP
jgi:hypothetical protein